MEKTSNRRVTIFAIILSLAAVGVLVFGFLMVSSSKVVMLQSISNLYTKFTEIDDDQAALLDKLYQSNNVGLRGNLNITSGKNKYTFNYDYLENKKDSKSNLVITGKKKNKEILNGNVFFDKDGIYLFLKDVTPNYYKVISEYRAIFRSINSDDYEKLVGLLKDSMESAVKNDDIAKEKTTVKYNGSEKKVTKLTYSFTTKTLEKVMNNFIKSIKADKTLYNDIANCLGISKKELGKQLDSSLKSIKEAKQKELFKYQVYYYGFNKIIQYELYSEENNTFKEYINLTINNVNYLKLEFEKNNKTYTFNGEYLNLIEFSGTLSENLLEIVFKLDKEYKLDIVFSNDISEKNFKSIYQITMYSKENDKEKELFLIDANMEYYFGEKIDSDIDLSTATDLDEDAINTLLQSTLGISLEDLKRDYPIPNIQ